MSAGGRRISMSDVEYPTSDGGKNMKKQLRPETGHGGHFCQSTFHNKSS